MIDYPKLVLLTWYILRHQIDLAAVTLILSTKTLCYMGSDGGVMMIIKLQKQEQVVGKKAMIRRALQTLPQNLQAVGEVE